MMEERDFEAEAAKDGWAPLEQWKGDPDKWKSAEQFVTDGEKINGYLKSKVERLDDRVNSLLESNKKLHEMSQRQVANEKKEKDKLIKELAKIRKQAITEGDGEAFESADSQLNELRAEPKQEQPKTDPLAEQWLADNGWYKDNKKLKIFADGLADDLVQQGYTGRAYFQEITRQVKEVFPDEFENKNRNKPNGVEGGGDREVSGKSRTVANLPADAKAELKRLKNDIEGYTDADYLAQYDWD